MNKTELKQLIKESVREAVREELVELFKKPQASPPPAAKPSLKEMLSEETSQTIPNQSPKIFKKYTNNELLNQILNETTVKIPREGSMVSGLSEIGSEVGKSTEMLKEVSAVNPEVAGTLKNALTRDYSQLLKAVNKKTRTPGYVPQSDKVRLES